jgi:hypothetical protein
VIRYGDEIGMGDNLALPERNFARTPKVPAVAYRLYGETNSHIGVFGTED